MPETITIPLSLWQEIRKVLEARQFISVGEDEDNDYEVLAVLRAMGEVNGSQ